MTTTLPPFLYGCLDWRVNGLHWAQEPPIDLLSSAALSSDNPWIVVAAAVEHAKVGRHDQARRLIQFFHQHEPFALSRVALLCFGSIAVFHDLSELRTVLNGDDADARGYAAGAAALAGRLDLVPDMLNAWAKSSSVHHHEVIGIAISDLLETEVGPIVEYMGTSDDAPRLGATDDPAKAKLIAIIGSIERLRGPSPFPDLVRDSYDRLRAKWGDSAIVWKGEPLSVPRLVTEFLAASKDPSPNHPFIDLRHRFEAWTGEDCRRFFYGFEPQRLEMAATLEDFVRSGKLDAYQPGVRYFWGHPVP